MKPINISSLIKKYGPGYIAKSKKTGKVIAHAKRLDFLFNKTKDKTDVVISWVPNRVPPLRWHRGLGVDPV